MHGHEASVPKGTARSVFEEAERRYLDTYDVKAHPTFVELPDRGLRLRVFESGEGPPMVMLHSGGGFGLQWLPLFPYLQDFHLFAPDMPGRGLSDRFDYHGTDVRAHGAAVIKALLDVLGLGRVVLVGSSFGAYSALAFARESPERVAALCLFGSPALVLDNRDLPIQARLLGLTGAGRLLLKLSTEKQERSSWQVFSGQQAVQRLPDAFFAYSYREGKLPGSARTIASLFGQLITLRGWRRSLSWTANELSEIGTQTLWIWGRQDVFGTPDLAQRIVATMPNARLELLDAGHHAWYDSPQRCANLVREFVGSAA